MGQVNLDSRFGQAIRDVCSRPDVNVCVDIGAWNGLGTTQCIVSGLSDQGAGHVHSFEVDDAMFEKAKSVWAGNSYVSLYKERLAERMLTIDEVQASRNYSNIASADWRTWYAGEKANFDRSTVGTLPERIDFVVIDGGEFSGQGDWDAVKKHHPRYVALDDTLVVETASVLDEMLASGEWMILYEGSDRNGWAILYKDGLAESDEVGVAEPGVTDTRE
jgi:hypothetical protein